MKRISAMLALVSLIAGSSLTLYGAEKVARGKLSNLRVTNLGPPNNEIVVDVTVESKPLRLTFGDTSNVQTRFGMLQRLRRAHEAKLSVVIDFEAAPALNGKTGHGRIRKISIPERLTASEQGENGDCSSADQTPRAWDCILKTGSVCEIGTAMCHINDDCQLVCDACRGKEPSEIISCNPVVERM